MKSDEIQRMLNLADTIKGEINRMCGQYDTQICTGGKKNEQIH
jgi:hypothetical protein